MLPLVWGAAVRGLWGLPVFASWKDRAYCGRAEWLSVRGLRGFQYSHRVLPMEDDVGALLEVVF